jgi:hypothetical protein
MSEIEDALHRLHSAGLKAEESKFVPGGLVGGLQVIETQEGKVYQHSFLIHPEWDDFRVGVAGPGNLSFYQLVPNLDRACEVVIAEYLRRGQIPG